MASIYRRLLSPNKKEEQLLVFVIKHGRNIRLDYSSKIKLHRKYWNLEKSVKRTFPEYKKFNDLIKSMEAQIQVTVSQMVMLESDITSREVITKLDIQFQRYTPVNNGEKNRKLSFYRYAEIFINHSTVTKKWGTVKTYNQTVNRLKEFDPKLDFKDINMAFYGAFIGYLRQDRGILDSTIGKHIKNLKTILNEATEQGYNNTFEYRSKKFKTFRHEADTIYLTRSELGIVAELDLSSRPGLDRVRDLFIIGCYTGLRFSDLRNLKAENIISRDENRYILIRTQKTGKQVMIPLNSVATTTIDKYCGNLPEAISNQKMNDALKEICKLAELSTSVQITKIRAGIQEKYSLPKYQLVTTHTARRSFATNAYLSGVPGLAIMKITGHKSESSFMKYIKGSQEENATTLSKHPFFH